MASNKGDKSVKLPATKDAGSKRRRKDGARDVVEASGNEVRNSNFNSAVVKLRLRKRKTDVDVPPPVREKATFLEEPPVSGGQTPVKGSQTTTRGPEEGADVLDFEGSDVDAGDSPAGSVDKSRAAGGQRYHKTPDGGRDAVSSGEDGSVSPLRSPPSTPHYSPNGGDRLNVRVSDTDGYDSDLLRRTDMPLRKVVEKSSSSTSVIDFSKLSYFDGKGDVAPEIDTQFASILTKNWWELDKSVPENRDKLKDMFKKYNPPANCPFDPPKINEPIRAMLTAAQKSVDMQFSGVQKSMAKTMNSVIGLFCEGQKKSPDFHAMAQSVADIAAMLGDASHEVSRKRRAFIRGSLVSEYKALCTHKGSRNWLFGDDLSKDIADLKLTNKLKKKPSYEHGRYQKGSYRQNRYQPYGSDRSSFLSRGRGNLPYSKRDSYEKFTSKDKRKPRRGKKPWSK